MLDEKTKQRQQQALLTENPLSDLEEPPSPIKRHVKWKMARTKRYGQMTSKAAKEISDRIVSCSMIIINFELIFVCFIITTSLTLSICCACFRTH